MYFKEYIKTARTPTKADAVQLIDGISMATVQERAKATFKTIGQNFLWWLQRCTADYDGPVIFVTWDAKGATQTLELLSCEMRRAALSLLNNPPPVFPRYGRKEYRPLAPNLTVRPSIGPPTSPAHHRTRRNETFPLI